MPLNIFMSYRRNDVEQIRRLLLPLLQSAFPDSDIFIDVDSLQPGAEWRKVISDRITAANVMLVVIGPDWDPDGAHMSAEVSEALKQDKYILPILLDRSTVPPADEMPGETRRLLEYNAIELRPEQYNEDSRRLIAALQSLMFPSNSLLSKRNMAEWHQEAFEPALASAGRAGDWVIDITDWDEAAHSTHANPGKNRPELIGRRDRAAKTDARNAVNAVLMLIGIGVLGVLGSFFVGAIWTSLSSGLAKILNFVLGAATLPPVGAVNDEAVESDIVEASVFAPSHAPLRSPVLVQVFLHVPEKRAEAAVLALQADSAAEWRNKKCLRRRIARGAFVDVAIDDDELEIDQPADTIVWNGEPESCTFKVRFPAKSEGREFLPVIKLRVDGVEVGNITFKMTCDSSSVLDGPETQPISKPQGEDAHNNRIAFFSYSSKDRVKVLEAAEHYRNAGIEVFQDILSLKDSERYEPRIFAAIDNCDLFTVFWSEPASESKWVLDETLHAVKRRNSERKPDLSVYIVDPSNVPRPPPSLEDRHFDSVMRLIRLGAQVDQANRKAKELSA